MHKIIQRIEKSIILTNEMIAEHPESVAFKSIKATLESLKDELLESEPNKDVILQRRYGLVRGYQTVLHVESTPFGEELGYLLIDLQQY